MVRYVKIGYNLYLLQCESIICKIQVVKRFILHFVKNVIDLHFTLCYNEGTHKRKELFYMNVAYVRVSTVEQNEDRQLEALKKHSIDKWFTEKVSGKDTNRPQLKAMLDFVREGDTIYIHDFSRLARSTKDLLDIVEELKAKNVHLVSNKENIDTSTPSGKLMLTMIGAIAEFERANLLERQKEGIAVAKEKGKYKGGQVKKIDSALFDKLYDQYNHREINKKQFAEKLNVSRPTLDKLLKDKGLQ